MLGKHLVKAGSSASLLTPARKELSLNDKASVENYCRHKNFEAVIHCAAMARMAQCEKDPAGAVQTNIVGTAYLVEEVIKKQEELKKDIRFVYISTDGVYPSESGHYKETDPALPYNRYGWTKLSGETAVNVLHDFCVIRTRFYDPDNLKFDSYATDSFTSALPVTALAGYVWKLLDSQFKGTINVGDERKSDYDRFKKIKPEIKKCTVADILKYTPFKISRDASLNTELWKKFKLENGL